MPHARSRLISEKILKKLEFFPVLALQGARQVGKSFLVRELLKSRLPQQVYISFDDESDASKARAHPRTFLQEYLSAKPLIIDEAQKVPKIFDAIKFEVDQKRTPKRYLLLGSTEFSLLNQIRESLTGRMGRIRIFPMTLRETFNQADRKSFLPSRREFLQYLNTGGMPGFFSVRDRENRDQLIEDWLNLVCYRDLIQYRKFRLEPTLALKILSQLARLEEPTLSNLSSVLHVDARKIKSHLQALEELFVIRKLESHPTSKGKKPIFLLLDVAIANYLGASEERKLHVFLLNERLVYHSIHTNQPCFLSFYRSSGGNMIHLIEEVGSEKSRGFLILQEENIKPQVLRIAEAFLGKNKKAAVTAYAPVLHPAKGNIPIQPWEDFCC